MARVYTNNTNTITSFDGLAFYTNFLYGCSYFHIITENKNDSAILPHFKIKCK